MPLLLIMTRQMKKRLNFLKLCKISFFGQLANKRPQNLFMIELAQKNHYWECSRMIKMKVLLKRQMSASQKLSK